MIKLSALVVSVVCLPVATSAALEPSQYVLALQQIQDQLVKGDKMAPKAQREMLDYMAKRFAKSKVVDWQKKQNAEALLIYMLSGGNPEFIGKLLEIKNQPKLPENVLQTSLAYVFGNYQRARKLLKTVKVKELSRNTEAQFAIMQATLYAEKEPEKALKYLSDVRLWKPGTLLEEAALRRSISLAGDLNQTKRFLMWTSQYVRRFRHSYYLPEFVSSFSFYVTKLNLAAQPELIEQIVRIIDYLEPNTQASIYLTVARTAVLDGNNKSAQLMAANAIALLKKNTNYAARAMLYDTAARVATETPGKVTELLLQINRGLLGDQDQKLYDTVKLMIEEVQKKPVLSKTVIAAINKPEQQRKPGESKLGQVLPVVSKAQKLFDDANKLLEEK